VRVSRRQRLLATRQGNHPVDVSTYGLALKEPWPRIFVKDYDKPALPCAEIRDTGELELDVVWISPKWFRPNNLRVSSAALATSRHPRSCTHLVTGQATSNWVVVKFGGRSIREITEYACNLLIQLANRYIPALSHNSRFKDATAASRLTDDLRRAPREGGCGLDTHRGRAALSRGHLRNVRYRTITQTCCV
jgi:hypothetical protein